MRKLPLFILFITLCHQAIASYSYAPQSMELDGKIINYYEVISEDRDQIKLASRGSELQLKADPYRLFEQTSPRFTSHTDLLKKKWRALPHQLTITGANRAQVKFPSGESELYFDTMVGEIYFNDRDLADAFSTNYRRHFIRLYQAANPNNFSRESRSLNGPDNLIWLSSMTCRNINFNVDCDGKKIRKGLRCTIDFIFDGNSTYSLKSFHHF